MASAKNRASFSIPVGIPKDACYIGIFTYPKVKVHGTVPERLVNTGLIQTSTMVTVPSIFTPGVHEWLISYGKLV